MRKRVFLSAAACLLASGALAKEKKPKTPQVQPIDVYVRQANERAANGVAAAASPGSTWHPGALLADLARDSRANQVDDLVTIVVAENATAVATGSTKSSRSSSAKYSVDSLFGKKSANGALANMANTSGAQSLQGNGTTSRNNTLTATVSARVTGVLPNGYLVLEGIKNIVVNSENQLITVRGVARPADVGSDNTVRSDHLAQLDVRINGKGVVGDAIRRPFFLYRLLLGLLPF